MQIRSYISHGMLAVALSGCIVISVQPRQAVIEEKSAARSLANYSPYDVDTSVSAEDLSFTELKSILDKNQFRKIEDLLEYLKDQKPEYMKRYTLAHTSFSLHESSKLNPRAIVYGKSGNFIITFNGDKSQKNFSALEVVEFNRRHKKFEFREIEFAEDRQDSLPFKISQIGGPQKKCLECHSNGKPIWESYPLWPGLYGADDDLPMAKSENAEPSSLYKLPEGVQKDFDAYLNASESHPRYRNLPPMPDSMFVAKFGRRPNVDLTGLLYSLNAERIARIIKAKTHMSFRFVFIYLASACSVDEYMTPKLWELMNKYRPKYDAAVHRHNRYRFRRLMDDFQLDENSLRSDFDGKLLKDNPAGERISRGSQSKDDFAEALYVKSSGKLEKKINDHMLGMYAVASEYFPGSAPETWATTLYDDVPMFNDGLGSFAKKIQDAIEKELMTKSDRAAFQKTDGRAGISICERTSKLFPVQLRNPVQ